MNFIKGQIIHFTFDELEKNKQRKSKRKKGISPQSDSGMTLIRESIKFLSSTKQVESIFRSEFRVERKFKK